MIGQKPNSHSHRLNKIHFHFRHLGSWSRSPRDQLHSGIHHHDRHRNHPYPMTNNYPGLDGVMPAESDPAPTPEEHVGRFLIPNAQFPKYIDNDEALEAFITSKLASLGASSSITAQRIAFALIHHTRLTPAVLAHLRQQYLPSFSTMTWRDILSWYCFDANTLRKVEIQRRGSRHCSNT